MFFRHQIAAAWPYEWSRSQLLMASGVRLLLVPLMLLCAAPRHSPHIVGDVRPLNTSNIEIIVVFIESNQSKGGFPFYGRLKQMM